VLFAENSTDLDRLDEELRRVSALTPALFGRVLTDACNRIAALRLAGKIGQLDRLIATGAWTDAACVLVEFELPAWTVRRLVREEGEWLCSLSCQPHASVALDDAVDAWHEQLPLVILRAFVEARRRSSVVTKSAAPVRSFRPMPGTIICCDNFA
jgi:hypothetical protein